MLEGLWRHDGWDIGLIDAPIDRLVQRVPRIRWLGLGGTHGFAADPFGIEHRGRRFVFFEVFSYRRHRGHIAFCELASDGSAGPVEAAILEPYHLSYPYLVEHDGEIVCIPESHEAGRLDVWCARRFPRGWYRRATLVELPLVDATPFRYGDRWWMFATLATAAPNARLLVFSADDLFGPWRPHRANPVKVNAAGARPGGTPFVVDGRLFRPAQDCSQRYGGQVIINEVVQLDDDVVHEEAVATIAPEAGGLYPHGLHTLSACGSQTLVDGNRLRFVPSYAAYYVRGLVRRGVQLSAPGA